MNSESYISGRTILQSQHRSFHKNSIGKEIKFGGSTAIELYKNTDIYREILQLFLKLWEDQSGLDQLNHINYSNAASGNNRANTIKFVAPQCMTLTRKEWNSNLKTDFMNSLCSWKSNGIRYALFITCLKYSSERVCVMINRKNDMFLVSLPIPISYFDGTIITGDLIEDSIFNSNNSINSIKTFRFELDDVQAYRGIIVSNYDAISRQLVVIQIVQSLTTIENPFSICTKPWVYASQISHLVKQCHLKYLFGKDIVNEGNAIDYNFEDNEWKSFWQGTKLPDGLIHKKIYAPLGKYMVHSTLKWKPQEARTIDLLPIIYKMEDKVDLYTYWGSQSPPKESALEFWFFRNLWWRKRFSQNIQETFSPLSSRLIYEALEFELIPLKQIDCLNEKISEWVKDENIWKPIKFRDTEKNVANHDSVVRDEIEDSQAGMITLEELIQFSAESSNKLDSLGNGFNNSNSFNDFESSSNIGINRISSRFTDFIKPSLSMSGMMKKPQSEEIKIGKSLSFTIPYRFPKNVEVLDRKSSADSNLLEIYDRRQQKKLSENSILSNSVEIDF